MELTAGVVVAFYRRIIRIRAEDSPNVRLALTQLRAGKEPTGEMLVPGVLSWHDYRKRRQTWDKVKQCIGLDAMFWQGAELLLYPCDWLDRAEYLWSLIKDRARKALAMGVDPAEGGDKTAFSIVDHLGLIRLIAEQTIDTAVIVPMTIGLIKEYNLDPRRVCFDRGGGGTQLAHELRARGYPVKTVAFGEAVTPEPEEKPPVVGVKKRQNYKEEKYPYKNRKAEMYGTLREMLRPPWAPDHGGIMRPPDRADTSGFALPPHHPELRRQLALMPLKYDDNGRMYLPPKTRKTRSLKNEKTLEEIIGHSPDEADSLVLAVHALKVPSRGGKVGAAW